MVYKLYLSLLLLLITISTAHHFPISCSNLSTWESDGIHDLSWSFLIPCSWESRRLWFSTPGPKGVRFKKLPWRLDISQKSERLTLLSSKYLISYKIWRLICACYYYFSLITMSLFPSCSLGIKKDTKFTNSWKLITVSNLPLCHYSKALYL